MDDTQKLIFRLSEILLHVNLFLNYQKKDLKYQTTVVGLRMIDNLNGFFLSVPMVANSFVKICIQT